MPVYKYQVYCSLLNTNLYSSILYISVTICPSVYYVLLYTLSTLYTAYAVDRSPGPHGDIDREPAEHVRATGILISSLNLYNTSIIVIFASYILCLYVYLYTVRRCRHSEPARPADQHSNAGVADETERAGYCRSKM